MGATETISRTHRGTHRWGQGGGIASGRCQKVVSVGLEAICVGRGKAKLTAVMPDLTFLDLLPGPCLCFFLLFFL